MSRYDAERSAFVAEVVARGMSDADAEGIARDANTVQRWAVMECNGEVEAESVKGPDGEWVETGRWVHPYNVAGPGPIKYAKIGRPSGPHAEARIRRRIAAMGAGWEVETSGDPRWCCVKVKAPGLCGNCGNGEWYAVPVRRY